MSRFEPSTLIAYDAARAAAERMKAAGLIVDFQLSTTPALGRCIHVVNDQGVDPDPLYADFAEAHEPFFN
jgi:hypothetical protein